MVIHIGYKLHTCHSTAVDYFSDAVYELFGQNHEKVIHFCG